jgi:hypothetical protein
MIGKFFDKLLHEDEEEIGKEAKGGKGPEKKEKKKIPWVSLVIVLAVALIPRLIYIFKIGNPNFPGWYTDTFHHWQIAYLSKEIGFHQGFLRLWDFKGMEFFWGLLHPLVLAILMTISGSTSILVPRLLSTFGGAVSIVLLFVLMKRYFNSWAAWAVVIFASFFPITLFSNTVGMQEELAFPFVLGSMLVFPAQPVVAGIFLALASMVRAEYWLFSAGLVFATILLRRNINKVMILVVTYLSVIFVYMKYLVSYTGNWIYQIYWNFLASVKGEWFENLPVVGEKLLAKRINQGIFAFGLAGVIVTLIKRPKYALFYLFGFGNILFIGFMVGFGSYVKGYIPRFWVDRLYNWPYLFTAILVILLFFYYLPKWVKLLKIPSLVFGVTILISGLVASQLIWKSINFFMQPVEQIYLSEESWADEIGKAYDGGRVLLPEDRPYITYFLVNDWGIKGRNMVGQMFDPFFYFEDKRNPFDNWGENREIVLDWLINNNISLIALTTPKPTYLGLIEREAEYFEKLPSENILLYRVNIK